MEQHEPVTSDTSSLPSNGHSKPTNLSSNATLIWRIFLPVFGTVFLTGLSLAFWVTEEEELYLPYPVILPRVILLVVILAWLWYVRAALWPLKRIDANDAHLFVTNYWTTVRYPWTDVEQLEKRRFRGRNVVALRLKAPGRFGQEILFIPGSHYHAWMRDNKKEYLIPAN